MQPPIIYIKSLVQINYWFLGIPYKIVENKIKGVQVVFHKAEYVKIFLWLLFLSPYVGIIAGEWLLKFITKIFSDKICSKVLLSYILK